MWSVCASKRADSPVAGGFLGPQGSPKHMPRTTQMVSLKAHQIPDSQERLAVGLGLRKLRLDPAVSSEAQTTSMKLGHVVAQVPPARGLDGNPSGSFSPGALRLPSSWRPPVNLP